MAYNDNKQLSDILGILPSQPNGRQQEAVSFLRSICEPATDELEHIIGDEAGSWRRTNSLKILRKASDLYSLSRTGIETSHPRVIYAIINHGSWAKSYLLQEMWAGLLVSSCTPEGNDESNIIFTSLLSQMTAIQARILEYGCKTAEKYILKEGGVAAKQKLLKLAEMRDITGIDDYHRLDRELDHLRSLGLITGGFDGRTLIADITPSQLGLHMYVRCRGIYHPPIDYFTGVVGFKSHKALTV